MRFGQLKAQPREILFRGQRLGRGFVSGHQEIGHHSSASLLDYSETFCRITTMFGNQPEVLFIQVAHTFNESRLSERTVGVADHYILNRSGAIIGLIGLAVLLPADLNLCQDIQQLRDQGHVPEGLRRLGRAPSKHFGLCQISGQSIEVRKVALELRNCVRVADEL